MLRSPPALLLLALVLTIPGANAATQAWAPSGVVVVSAETGALLSWVPGSEPADSYRVYGQVGSTLTLLASTSATSTTVPSGYASYSVAGVKGNVESDAVTGLWPVCPYVSLSPPDVWVGECAA